MLSNCLLLKISDHTAFVKILLFDYIPLLLVAFCS